MDFPPLLLEALVIALAGGGTSAVMSRRGAQTALNGTSETVQRIEKKIDANEARSREDFREVRKELSKVGDRVQENEKQIAVLRATGDPTR